MSVPRGTFYTCKPENFFLDPEAEFGPKAAEFLEDVYFIFPYIPKSAIEAVLPTDKVKLMITAHRKRILPRLPKHLSTSDLLTDAIRITDPDSLPKDLDLWRIDYGHSQTQFENPKKFWKDNKRGDLIARDTTTNYGRDSLSLHRFIRNLILHYQGRRFIDGELFISPFISAFLDSVHAVNWANYYLDGQGKSSRARRGKTERTEEPEGTRRIRG